MECSSHEGITLLAWCSSQLRHVTEIHRQPDGSKAQRVNQISTNPLSVVNAKNCACKPG